MRSRPDSEHEQALIRLTFGILWTLYALYAGYAHGRPFPDNIAQALWIGALFCAASLTLIVGILFYPAANPPRRVAGMVMDIAATSYALTLLGDVGMPIYAIYLWLILGNGFRYGLGYLLLATTLSAVGFSVVIFTSPFWHDNPRFAAGLLFVLCIIPLYAGAMIRKIHKGLRQVEESDREKSQFIARIANAFRTPLNGVTGMTNVLMQTPLSSGQKEIAETVVASGRMLNELLDNVSHLNKIETGEIEIAQTPFNLHVLINALMSIFMPLANERGLEFRVNLGSEVPATLTGDPHYLRQILVNLISNGIKFTSAGFVELTVTVMAQVANQSVLRFEIKDTGSGMTEEAKRSLFATFNPRNHSTYHIYGGAGLGTTVANQLVGLMGGKLEMVSQLGNGTVFWFDLPFSTNGRSSQARDLSTGLLACRCLLVTSNETLRVFVTSLLERWSAPYTVVDSSASALATLKESVDSGTPYLAVLVDAGAPQAYAQAFAGAVAAETALFGLTLTVFRPNQDPHSTSDYLAAGYSSVMNSPPDTRQLFNMLHAVTAREIEQPETRPASLPTLAQAAAKSRQRLRILVAEDNPVNQAITRKILVSEGYQVDVVANGREALDALTANDYDLVIADLRMPEMGGLEAMRTYNASSGHRRVPWLVLTADVTTETMRECARSGADGYLTKPVNPTLLLARVSQVTEVARQTIEMQPPETSTESELIDTARVHAASSRDRPLPQSIRRFEENADICIDRIQHAISRKDHTGIRLHAITLESYCSDIGASRMVEVLSGLYTMPIPDLLRNAEAELERLTPVYRDTIEALKALTRHA